MSPDPGPELDTRYVPGSPGAAWSEEEISTRVRESGKEIEGNEGQRRAPAEQEFKASAQQILCTC